MGEASGAWLGEPLLHLKRLALTAVLVLVGGGAPADDRVPERSPRSVAVSGRWAIAANSGTNTASLVDLEEGVVAATVDVGRRPFGVAMDAQRAVVTNWGDGTLTVLDVKAPWLRVAGTVAVGDEPRGVALDGTKAFVALAGENRVAVVDLVGLAVVASAAVGTEPWHVAVGGGRLAVGNARSRDVSVLDAETLGTLHTVRLHGPNVRGIAIRGDWAYVVHSAERGRATTRGNIDFGWVLASRLSRVPLAEAGPREAIALDPRGQAVADLEALAVGEDGTIALAAGGTHELLLLRGPLPFVAFGGPGDHIEADLLRDPKRFRRVPLGGRPVDVALSGGKAIVANYLEDSLQVVDLAAGKLERTISLGGPAAKTLARRGEAIFHDAQRSFRQWYSCHSCHTEGHTNGALFDTFNDGREGNPKKTLSLRGVTKTAPYTWHGWQQDLRASIEGSLTKTMQGPKPSAEDLDALVAFLETNDFRPSRPVTRGAAVFEAKGCVRCHKPPHYTSSLVVTVGLESEGDAYKGFNPPSLLGVRTRAPFLHDGRAKTLREMVEKHHPRDKELTPAEIADLVAFLESL